MAVKNLDFRKTNDGYEAFFSSTGNSVIHLLRNKGGVIAVRAYIQGPYSSSESVTIAQLQNPFSTNAIFQVKVPVGVGVVIESETEVTRAYILEE